MTKRNFDTLEVGGYYKDDCGYIFKMVPNITVYEDENARNIYPFMRENNDWYLENIVYTKEGYTVNQYENLIEKVDIVPCPSQKDKLGLCGFCYGSGYVNAVQKSTGTEIKYARREDNPPLPIIFAQTMEESSSVELPKRTIQECPNVDSISREEAAKAAKIVSAQKPRKFKVGDRVKHKINTGYELICKVIHDNLDGSVNIEDESGGTYTADENKITLVTPIKLFVGAICELSQGSRVMLTAYSNTTDKYYTNFESWMTTGRHEEKRALDIVKVLNPQDEIE